jgi:hypothetical protein
VIRVTKEFVAIRRPRIYRSRVKYSDTEGSYEYDERFCLRSVEMEELSITGPFFCTGRPTDVVLQQRSSYCKWHCID